MINIDYLKTILKPIVDVYDDHATEKNQVSLPYVVLLEMPTENVFADNQTYQEVMPMQIILHQAKRNHELETQIKGALIDNNIPFNYSTEWLKEHLLYATTFDING